MSVGGKVIEVLKLPSKVYINTKETTTDEECAIYVERTPEAEQIVEGDAVWWQGGSAYWTPADKSREDFRIPRIGYSGVPRPTAKVKAKVQELLATPEGERVMAPDTGTRLGDLMEWGQG